MHECHWSNSKVSLWSRIIRLTVTTPVLQLSKALLRNLKFIYPHHFAKDLVWFMASEGGHVKKKIAKIPPPKKNTPKGSPSRPSRQYDSKWALSQ